MLLDEIDINGATVTHYMDEKHVNHIEIRKNKCIGFGHTYQQALKDLNNKIIEKTLSESQEKFLRNGIA